MSVYGYITEAPFGIGKKRKSLPAEYKLSEDDIIFASKFRQKTKDCIDYMNKENFEKEDTSRVVGVWYWGVLGTTFSAAGSAVKYEPKMNYLAPLIKKYCVDKVIRRIKNDMENTIKALEKKDPNSMTPVQKTYYADIKSAVGKL